VRSYLKGYYDDNVYFKQPRRLTCQNLNDDYYLPILQKGE